MDRLSGLLLKKRYRYSLCTSNTSYYGSREDPDPERHVTSTFGYRLFVVHHGDRVLVFIDAPSFPFHPKYSQLPQTQTTQKQVWERIKPQHSNQLVHVHGIKFSSCRKRSEVRWKTLGSASRWRDCKSWNFIVKFVKSSVGTRTGSNVTFHPTIICNKWRSFRPMRRPSWISTVKRSKGISWQRYGCVIRRRKWPRIRFIKKWSKTSNIYIWMPRYGRHCRILSSIWGRRDSVWWKKPIGVGTLPTLNGTSPN